MTLSRPRFSLEELMVEMAQVSMADLDLAQLQERVDHLQLRDDLWRQHITFSDRIYTRHSLYYTAQFELLLLCWQPGQSSTIHDHADSLNVTCVYEGTLTSREFVSTSHGIRLVKEMQVKPGSGVSVNRHRIHQLANTSNAPLVTLHGYARPLENIQVYRPDSDQIEQVVVRCPLTHSME